MKKIKPAIFTICSVFLSLAAALTACAPVKEVPPEKLPYPYESDFICGYFLSLRDDNDEKWVSPSSNDFENPSAIKYYATVKYASAESQKGYLYVTNGLPVNSGTMKLEGDPLCSTQSGKITLHDKIYFTSELADKTAVLHLVLYDAEKRVTYTEIASYNTLSGGFTVMFGSEMTALIDDGTELRQITYTPDFSVTFARADEVCGIEIIQFGKNDVKLKSSVYNEENYNSLPHIFSATESVYPHDPLEENAEYVLIKIERKNSFTGEIYAERTLVCREDNSRTVTVPLPLNGFLQNHEIRFDFSET